MASIPLQAPCELVRPDYNIYQLGQLYKIVRFNSTAPRLGIYDKEKCQHYDDKLEASLSRSRRVVLELALCNDWKYFCTFTIAKENFDRKDLKAWHKSFSQWLRDQRKKYKKQGMELAFDYVLVPELHKDGCWHMHGLFSDISPLLVSFRELSRQGQSVPVKLIKGDFYNWPDYQKKFGFCSFGEIRSKVGVSYYITEYIQKQLQDSCLDVGLNLYYCSHNLNRAVFHGDVYGRCDYLDKFLQKHYDFCSTGMTKVKDDLPWHFAMELMDYNMLEAFGCSDEERIPYVDDYCEAVQQVLDGF